jgi:hypothetical protein
VLDCSKSVRETISTRKHAENARHFVRRGLIDTDDARVSMLRTNHRRIGLAGKMEVVAELAAPRQEPRIFVARHRFADEAEIWFSIGHRRSDCGTDQGGS